MPNFISGALNENVTRLPRYLHRRFVDWNLSIELHGRRVAELRIYLRSLQAIKYSNATTSDAPIDATPTDSATDGNQFRLTGSEWHFNLSTKGLGNTGQGTWLLKATLFDGSTYSVWVAVKK